MFFFCFALSLIKKIKIHKKKIEKKEREDRISIEKITNS